MHKYQTIDGEYENKIEINRSVFICNIKGINDFASGMLYIKNITKKYSNATHNCYALLTIDGKQKFFDANEPVGTAGQPILQTLKNNGLNNTVAIVTRFYGGVKLGTAGLINAYSTSVNETIKVSKLITMHLCKKGMININYNELPLLLRDTNYIVLDTQYTDTVQVTIACPLKNIDKTSDYISAITAGKSAICWQNEGYYSYP